MLGFVPTGGAGSTAKVQEAYGSSGSLSINVTATFPSTPTSGNLLIAVMGVRGTGGSISAPAGWTAHAANVSSPPFDGGRIALYYRTAGAAEPTAVTFQYTDTKTLYIAEWTPATVLGTSGVGYIAESDKADASTLVTGSITPGVANALVFAGWVQSARLPGFAVQSPYSTDYQVGVDPSGPQIAFAHRIMTPATVATTATLISTEHAGFGAFLAAFSVSSGGITWSSAPDTVDENDGSSEDVDSVPIAVEGGAFWRGDLGDDLSIGTFRAVLGMETNSDVSVLVQGGDASDFSDAATIVQADYEATGSLTADTLEISFDPETHRYWRLVLDTAAQDVRVYEVGFAEAEVIVPTEPAKAILEIYVHDEDASRWGTATWATGPATGTEGIWSGAGWQDVTPEGVNVHVIWGSRQSSRGILAEQSPASWNVQTYDPERILDPGNFDSPYYPQLVAGVPIRISHESLVIRTGIVDEWHYKLKRPAYQGQILASDSWSLLNQAMVPPDTILGNTLYGRIRDAIDAAGIAVGGIPVKPRDGPIGPTIADWVEGAPTDDATSVGEHVRIAAEEVLWVPIIMADGSLGLRNWAVPLDRARIIGAPNLEDLEAVSHEDGTYSVVKVQVEDPDADPIIRKAAPMPRYGERVWERREPTIDPEGYAAAILAERPWPGVQWVPGAIHCFTAADVDYFGSLQLMERVTLTVPGAVSVQGRILGGELYVEHKKGATKGATWLFYFAVATDGATAIGSTILVADGTGENLLDDMTDTDFLEAD